MKLKWCFLILTILVLCIQPGLSAPGDIIWQQTSGGQSGEEWGYSLDTTADGGLLVTGAAYSGDGNVTGSHGNGDLWVIRLGADGSKLWDRAYGGNESDYGLSIKTTADGGSVVLGTTGSNNGDISGYHGNGDLWVLRLSPAGDILWQKVYGGNLTDEGGDILLLPDGGYMLTGYTMSDNGDPTGHKGGGDLWMIRLDQAGSIIWQKTIGGSRRDSGSSIIRTTDGGYAMTGNTYSSDGDVSANHGSSDLWVVRTDGNGSLLWQKSFGGSKLDWGHSLAEFPNGDLLVGGVTASADGDISLNHGAGDVWVLRLTASGDKIWEKTYGGSFSDNLWKAEISPRGGAFLVGETFSVDGDIQANHGDADIWISEIDANGTLLWSKTLGGSNYESGAWVKQIADGNLTITGTTRSQDGDVKNAKGEGDLWTVKIDANYIPVTNPVQNTTLAPVNTTPVVANQTVVTQPPAGGNTTGSIVQITPLPGSSAMPGDPDNDGSYEDLNGNGKIDLQDPAIFFANYDWLREHFPPLTLDFNKNGAVDFGDINALFAEASG